MTNIAELLKDAPEGTKLYSPLFGEGKLKCVNFSIVGYPIEVKTKNGESLLFDKYGRYFDNDTFPDAECVLFPSKEVRTWEGWKLPVEPKFKVRDSLQSGSHFTKILSINLEEERYYCDNRIISFENQDLWHLVPKPHYDISNFHAGMPVLVRDFYKHNEWTYAIFSHYNKDHHETCRFMASGAGYWQCIPFEGNEHLLGTTDMCPEEYVNW